MTLNPSIKTIFQGMYRRRVDAAYRLVIPPPWGSSDATLFLFKRNDGTLSLYSADGLKEIMRLIWANPKTRNTTKKAETSDIFHACIGALLDRRGRISLEVSLIPSMKSGSTFLLEGKGNHAVIRLMP